MPYIILFKDNPDAPADVREKHMAAHLAFLASHKAEIHAAGPLHDPDGKGAGGIWIVTADTADQADALVKSDPFWPTGLRDSYEILKWTQVFADGKARINVS